MTESPITKHCFDLEKRTLEFAKNVIKLCKQLPQNVINKELIGQLIDASGSIGANYREANDALSKKDFKHRIKITRKEAKETHYWLELLIEANPEFKEKIDPFDGAKRRSGSTLSNPQPSDWGVEGLTYY